MSCHGNVYLPYLPMQYAWDLKALCHAIRADCLLSEKHAPTLYK